MPSKLSPILLLILCFFGGATVNAESAVALLPNNTLNLFDTTTPGTVVPLSVTGLGINETLRGIDVSPLNGQLYALSVTTGSANNSLIRTYKINPITGTATLVGTTASTVPGAGDVATGVDFNPTVERIRYENFNDESCRIDPNNGALAGNDTDLTPVITTDVIAVAYDRNKTGNAKTTLFVINRDSSSLAIQGGLDSTPSPNGGVVTNIEPLGITLSPVNDGGFDISSSGVAYAALTDNATNLTGLYTISLTVAGGNVSFVGLVGSGAAEVYSLTILPADTDADGLVDPIDNCPEVANPDQLDSDADKHGNLCDTDQDGDGISNSMEAAIGSNPLSSDTDGDALADNLDACPVLPAATSNGCPVPITPAGPPETVILQAPKSGKSKKTSITFVSNQADAFFECAMDKKGYASCNSPNSYRGLKPGSHTFQVRALTPAGMLDLSPASTKWKVLKGKKRK